MTFSFGPLKQTHCFFEGMKGTDICLGCVENFDGFPLRGEGWCKWTKNGRPLKQQHTHTISVRPNFPKAEGFNSLVLSFFPSPAVLSLSLSLSFSLISPVTFVIQLSLIVILCSFFFFPLPLVPSGNAVDSGTQSVDALQQPQTACQWGLALQQGASPKGSSLVYMWSSIPGQNLLTVIVFTVWCAKLQKEGEVLQMQCT